MLYPSPVLLLCWFPPSVEFVAYGRKNRHNRKSSKAHPSKPGKWSISFPSPSLPRATAHSISVTQLFWVQPVYRHSKQADRPRRRGRRDQASNLFRTPTFAATRLPLRAPEKRFTIVTYFLPTCQQIFFAHPYENVELPIATFQIGKCQRKATWGLKYVTLFFCGLK